MAERDLSEELENLEKLKDKGFTVLGIRMTPAAITAAFALLSTVIGTLYGGFMMYQKIEEVAGLDLGAYQQQMEVMNAKVDGVTETIDAKLSGVNSKVQEAVDYARDIKNGLRDDILRIEQQTDRIEDTVRNTEDKVRTMIDDAEVRFETRREQLRMSQAADLKELEDRLNNRVQQALDNPLAE